MSKFVWFVIGLLVGDLWSGWLMHIFYVTVILFLLWSGHHPFIHCT
jgi:hypothetical protein